MIIIFWKWDYNNLHLNRFLYNIIIVEGSESIKSKKYRSLCGGWYAFIKISKPLKEYVGIHEYFWGNSNCAALDIKIIHNLTVQSFYSQYDHGGVDMIRCTNTGSNGDMK